MSTWCVLSGLPCLAWQSRYILTVYQVVYLVSQLDSALMHINQMFGDKSRMPIKLCSILQCSEICNKTFQEVYKFYWHAITCDEDVLFQELKRFVVLWCSSEKTFRLHDLLKELPLWCPNVKNFRWLLWFGLTCSCCRPVCKRAFDSFSTSSLLSSSLYLAELDVLIEMDWRNQYV